MVPDEILNEILTHIVNDSTFRNECGVLKHGTNPLLPVVLVNRRFNAVASPLMVRKWRMRSTGRGANGVGFARHLLEQPHRRSQVTSLALDVDSFDEAVFDDGKPTVRGNRWPRSFIPKPECEQLAESAEKACPKLAGMRYEDREVSWSDQIALRSPSAISTLVATWATELQELDLTLLFDAIKDDWEPGPWLFQLVKLATGVLSPRWNQGHDLPPPAVFTKLRSVTLAHHDDNYPDMEGANAAIFFRLPSLRVFKAYFMDASGLTLDEADQSGTALQPPADQLFPNGTSNVEEIHLYRSHISENGLSVLARACKRIRVLVLQWGRTFIRVNGFTFFSTALLEAIKLHFSTLEEILVESTGDTSADYYDNVRNVDVEAFGRGLSRCDKLERLTIDLEILYGDDDFDGNSSSYPLTDLLPSGLTSLSLGLGIMSLEPQLQATRENVLGLLRQCGPKERFSRLRTLQLTDCIMKSSKEQDFVILARNAGVVLTMRKCFRPECQRRRAV